MGVAKLSNLVPVLVAHVLGNSNRFVMGLGFIQELIYINTLECALT